MAAWLILWLEDSELCFNIGIQHPSVPSKNYNTRAGAGFFACECQTFRQCDGICGMGSKCGTVPLITCFSQKRQHANTRLRLSVVAGPPFSFRGSGRPSALLRHAISFAGHKMGQKPCCCEERPTHEAIPEVVQHGRWLPEQDERNERAERADRAGRIEFSQAQETEEVEEIQDKTDSGIPSMMISRKSRNLFTLKHFKIDRSLLRGIPLRESLRSCGSLWVKSPVELQDAACLHWCCTGVARSPIGFGPPWSLRGLT